ncbi:RING-type domain-containing protein [Psidium guajava]|nr:RING-type domain-containing protein [Psidium guajava]
MSAVEASPNLRDFLSVKDDDVGAAVGRRRGGDLTALTTRAVLLGEKLRSPPLASPTVSPRASRTLLDIIRNDELNAAGRNNINRDRKSWKSLKGKLRLRRAGVAWPSTVPVPDSDVIIGNCRSPSRIPRRDSILLDAPISDESTQEASRLESLTAENSVPTNAQPRRSSTRFGSLVPISTEPSRSDESSFANSPAQSLRPQISGHNSARSTPLRTDSALPLTRTESAPTSGGRDASQISPALLFTEEPAPERTRRLSAALAEERQLSAREAAAAQVAAEAEASQGEAAPVQPARMSLMDLLEETDRQVGLPGTRYAEGDGQEAEVEGGGGGGEQSYCCVCMVRHKGAAFIPCGHTFCRLCSRELWVSRGNCPLCNSFIVEILDIF